MKKFKNSLSSLLLLLIGVLSLNACSPKEKPTPPVTSISLNQTKKVLSVGEVFTLKATLTPENAKDIITWTTDNNKVATVKEGVVTAVAKGEAVITATLKNGNSASCTVTVEEAAVTTTIALNHENYSLTVGKTVTLEATLTPNSETEKITWATDNSKVATVKEGVVTAVAKGKAVITATLENGNAASCTVTVEEEEVVTTIALNFEDYSLIVGDEFTLEATLTPNSDTEKITWTTNNSEVATVKEGVVTAVAKGEAVITATLKNGNAASCTVTVEEEENDTPDNNRQVTITPWRVDLKVGETQQLTINYNGNPKEDVELQSTDQNVVTVTSDGLIKAVGAGSAQIKIIVRGAAQHNVVAVNVAPKVEQGKYSAVIRHIKGKPWDNPEFDKVVEDGVINDIYVPNGSASQNSCYVYLNIIENETGKTVATDVARQWEVISIDGKKPRATTGWNGDVSWSNVTTFNLGIKYDKYGIDKTIKVVISID